MLKDGGFVLGAAIDRFNQSVDVRFVLERRQNLGKEEEKIQNRCLFPKSMTGSE